jgi:hypothetical protein
MVTLDNSDGAAWLEDLAEMCQGFARSREVFQDKAGEHMIERVGRERHGVHVGVLKHHVPASGGSNPLPGGSQGVLGNIHRDDRRLGAPPGQRDSLSTDPAPDFKNDTSRWIERISMEELGERVGLIGEAFPLAA